MNAHATSTLIGDVSEARALRAVFRDAGLRPAISSTKALTGHGLSLAGAMESGFCALAMRDGFTPGSAHITRLDPECEGLNIIRSTLPTAAPRRPEEQQRLRRGQRGAPFPAGLTPRPCPGRLSALYRTAFVTGASSGLGRAFAEMLLAEGVRVWGTSRDPARLAGLGPRGFTPVALDLAAPDAAAGRLRRAPRPRRAAPSTSWSTTPATASSANSRARTGAVWQAQLDAMLGDQPPPATPPTGAMRARDRGCLVNVSSLAAEFPLPFMSGYNVAKAGLSALSESLLFESRGTAVRVIDFRPGDYRTAFNQAMQPPTALRAPDGPSASGACLDANLAAAPPPARAAGDLRRALLRRAAAASCARARFSRPGWRPLLARPGAPGGASMRAVSARYFGCRSPDPCVSKVRILVLTSSTGGGHDARAEAFAEWCFRLYRHDVDVRIEQMLEKSSVLQPRGGELLQPHPEGRALGPQDLLRGRRDAEPPQQPHRHLRQGATTSRCCASTGRT